MSLRLTWLNSRHSNAIAPLSKGATVCESAMGRACEFSVRPLIISCMLALVPAVLCRAQAGPVVSWGDCFPAQHNRAQDAPYKAVCAGGHHSLALAADGQLVAWGENGRGQCNVPQGNDFVAIAAGLYHNLALRSDGSVVAWGDNSRGQRNAPKDRGFLAIAAGSWHSLAIRSDGSLAAWGWGDQGQCDAPPGNDYRRIAAGHSHSLALKADGSLVAWGSNGDGECEVPSGQDFVGIAAGSLHNVALRSNGMLVAWGRGSEKQCNVPPGNDFVSVAVGSLHGLALKRDGSIVAWGSNGYGQCEVPAEERFAAIAAGGFHSLAIPGRLVVSAVAPAVETNANGRGEEVKDTAAKAAIDAEAASASTSHAPDVNPKRGEAAPIQPPDSRPSVAPELSAPEGLLNAGSESKIPTIQTPNVLTQPLLGPNVSANRDGALSESKAAEPARQQAGARLLAEPNVLSGRIDAPGKRRGAYVQAPQRAPLSDAQADVMPNQEHVTGKSEAVYEIFFGDDRFSEVLAWLGGPTDLIAVIVFIGCVLSILVIFFGK